MTQAHTCRACGAQVDSDAPFGHCPHCLIEHGFLLGTEGLEQTGLEGKKRIFGDYELLQQIGRGGMGIVYKARQISLDRIVALKMVRDSQLDSPMVIRRFQVEAETVAKLDHPNILPIYEVGEHEDHQFFSMKLVEGESLDEWICRATLQIPNGENASGAAIRQAQVRIATLMITIARAVHYAHQRGVLHRDLKPSNILLDAQERPHVTDFGVSKRLDRDLTLTEEGAVLGTPAYMAPEQAASKKVTIAADVYSLGAILYHLLTGCSPFQGATPMATLRLVLEQEPRKPRSLNKAIDADLETICLKCLEKDPQRRYASAEALAEDLDHWRRHETILAHPAGPIRRTSRWIRRNPVGASLISSLSVGLMASLILLKLAIDHKNEAAHERLTADRAREIIWQQIGVSDFWEKPDATVTISSEILSLVTGAQAAPSAGEEVARYRMGMLLEEMPVDAIIGYAHLLRYLEDHLGKAMRRTMRLDLKLYQENRTAIEDVVKGNVDFLKIGGQSYLRANASDPGILPLVAQHPIKAGVIFTRAQSEINSLEELKGKSIAASGTNSTVRLWAMFHLAQAGIAGTNLIFLESASSDAANQGARLKKAPKLKRGEKITDVSPVIEGVLTNKYDAGIVSEKAFRRAQAAGIKLKVLKRFTSSPVYWLSASKVPNETREAFQYAMVQLKDRAMFERLADNVKRYAEVTPGQLAELRQAGEYVTEQFEGERENSE